MKSLEKNSYKRYGRLNSKETEQKENTSAPERTKFSICNFLVMDMYHKLKSEFHQTYLKPENYGTSIRRML